MMVSIIIRSRNEEKWISYCLKSVFNQTYRDFEVILVDNRSTDKTVDRAKRFDVKVVPIGEFLPGKAINLGIRHSTGDIIVCLSTHCIPVNNRWLENLIRNLEDPTVAGVYGRQEPMTFSSDLNKRDLITVFGLDRRVQQKDPFFHNANSAFTRRVWERFPFDEEVTNIEDRVWAKNVIAEGYTIVYEPEASVYHHHGIHQDADQERCRNIVRILESLDSESQNRSAFCDVQDMHITALVPIKGKMRYCAGRPLVEFTIERALQSEFVDDVIVSTDNPEIAKVSERMGARAPFLRPPELSEEFVDVGTVLKYSIEKLEESGHLNDLVVVLEETYPFRRPGLIDDLIVTLAREGLDSVLTACPEYRTAWLKQEGQTRRLDDGFMPRQFKKSPVYISLFGLGCVTHPCFLREGRIIGDRVGLYEIHEPLSRFEVRDDTGLSIAESLIPDWWRVSGSSVQSAKGYALS